MAGSKGDETPAGSAAAPSRGKRMEAVEIRRKSPSRSRVRTPPSMRCSTARQSSCGGGQLSWIVIVIFVVEAFCFFSLGTIFCYYFWGDRSSGHHSRDALASTGAVGPNLSSVAGTDAPGDTTSVASPPAARLGSGGKPWGRKIPGGLPNLLGEGEDLPFDRRHLQSFFARSEKTRATETPLPWGDDGEHAFESPSLTEHLASSFGELPAAVVAPGISERRLEEDDSSMGSEPSEDDGSAADDTVTYIPPHRTGNDIDGQAEDTTLSPQHTTAWDASSSWSRDTQKSMFTEEYELSNEMWGHSETSSDNGEEEEDEQYLFDDAQSRKPKGLLPETESQKHPAAAGRPEPVERNDVGPSSGSVESGAQAKGSGTKSSQPARGNRPKRRLHRKRESSPDVSEEEVAGSESDKVVRVESAVLPSSPVAPDKEVDTDGGVAAKNLPRKDSDPKKKREEGSHAGFDERVVGHGVMRRMRVTRESLARIAKKKLRQFHCDMHRQQVCDYLKSDDQQYRVWFTLSVLYGLEWPFYSYADGGGSHFLQELLDHTRDFGPPAGASSLVRRRYEHFRECGMPQAFESGLKTLMDTLPSGAEFPSVLKKAAKDVRLRKVLFGMGDVHVPFDGVTTLAHVFDMVEDAMGLAWGKAVFLGQDPTAPTHCKPFSLDELYYKYMFAFSESRRYFSMVILLSRAMRQHVTQKPHNGIILLLVEQPHVSSSTSTPSPVAQMSAKSSHFPRRLSAMLSSNGHGLRSRGGWGGRRIPQIGTGDFDPDALQRLHDFQMLQEEVRQSILMKLESAIIRFYPTSKTMRRDIVKLPDVRVSGFFFRSADGWTHEKGLVGLEIDFTLMERFKEQTPPNGVLIQVTLLDLWATQPIEEWPDVMDPSKKLVSSYTATQLLKSELQWDQSLASFEWGRTKFIYSTVSEVFEYEKIDTVNRVSFDPDIQVMLLQSYSDFVANGKEDGMMAMIIEVLQRKPLGHSGVPREFRADRIVLQGTATPLEQRGGGKGQLYRKMQFGAGIDYGEVLQIEKAIRQHTVMLHIKILGLGHAAAEDWRGLKAHEILNRLAQRLRGTFEIHYVNPGKMPESPQVATRSVKCTNVIPDWILAMAVFATASFFIIFIILMMYHRKLDVPWWLSCWCSRFSPWEKDTADKQSTCPSDMESSRGEGDVDHVRSPGVSDDEDEAEDPGTKRSMACIIEEDYEWGEYGHAGDLTRASVHGSRDRSSFEHVVDPSLRSPYAGPSRPGSGCGSNFGIAAGFHQNSSSSVGLARNPSRGYDDVNMGHPVAPRGVLNSMPVVRTPTLTRAVSRRLGAESGFSTPNGSNI
ncbi:putative transmembrane protein [Toxoplasma gondii TgCatPRC2]|uniref:Putative transmembrane protein n=1 Tax=Toxoplasma gondii TgCatPRC2 TaxID=1130821 RepID=A0A151HP67_TOXGO|nr:putative transmembrane protein [Toxoplasma gondii TgCatPRC2]